MAGRGGKTEYPSLDSDAEIRKVLLDLDQDVAKSINDNINVLSENVELKYMVDLFVKNLSKTFNLCNMNKCRDEFATQYESVYNEQVMLLAKIHELQVVLEKKHKKAKRLRISGHVAFWTAFVPFVAVSFIALSSPSVSNVFNSQVSNGSGNVVERLKKLADSLEVPEKSLEKQQDLCRWIEYGTIVNKRMMEKIKILGTKVPHRKLEGNLRYI